MKLFIYLGVYSDISNFIQSLAFETSFHSTKSNITDFSLESFWIKKLAPL